MMILLYGFDDRQYSLIMELKLRVVQWDKMKTCGGWKIGVVD